MLFTFENKNYGLDVHNVAPFRRLYMFRWLCGQLVVSAPRAGTARRTARNGKRLFGMLRRSREL